jgi:hypothetical protein
VATPHKAAGQRNDPVASDPWAMATAPLATAAADPPLDPPAERSQPDVVRRPRDLLSGVLEEHGDPAGSPIEQLGNQEVQGGVEVLARRDRRVSQFLARHLLPIQQLELLDRAQPSQLHHPGSLARHELPPRSGRRGRAGDEPARRTGHPALQGLVAGLP